jgi:hypothetical protein
LAPVVLFLAWMTPRLLRRYEHITVASWFAGGLFLQLIVRHLSPDVYSLRTDVMFDDFNTVATKYSAVQLLERYTSIAKTLPLHAKANMPGKVVTFILLHHVTTSPEGLGIALVVLSSVGAVLLYYVARSLFHSRVTALYAMILYLVLPSRLAFLPFLNTITPVFVLALTAMLVAWFQARAWQLLVGLGLLLYVAVLFEPAPLAAAPLFLALVVREAVVSRLSRRDVTALVGLVPAGFLVAHAVMMLTIRFDIFEALRLVSRDARSFNAFFRRGHGEFLGQNLREFFVQAGVALSLVTLFTVVQNLSVVVGDRHRIRNAASNPSVMVGLGLVGTLMVLEVAGINRGETARLWIFLACFLPLVVVDLCVRAGRWFFSLVLACTLAQAIIVVSVFAPSFPTFFHYLRTRAPGWDGSFLLDIYAAVFLGVAAAWGVVRVVRVRRSAGR